jgi:hypothetical protein
LGAGIDEMETTQSIAKRRELLPKVAPLVGELFGLMRLQCAPQKGSGLSWKITEISTSAARSGTFWRSVSWMHMVATSEAIDDQKRISRRKLPAGTAERQSQ